MDGTRAVRCGLGRACTWRSADADWGLGSPQPPKGAGLDVFNILARGASTRALAPATGER